MKLLKYIVLFIKKSQNYSVNSLKYLYQAYLLIFSFYVGKEAEFNFPLNINAWTMSQ